MVVTPAGAAASLDQAASGRCRRQCHLHRCCYLRRCQRQRRCCRCHCRRHCCRRCRDRHRLSAARRCVRAAAAAAAAADCASSSAACTLHSLGTCTKNLRALAHHARVTGAAASTRKAGGEARAHSADRMACTTARTARSACRGCARTNTSSLRRRAACGQAAGRGSTSSGRRPLTWQRTCEPKIIKIYVARGGWLPGTLLRPRRLRERHSIVAVHGRHVGRREELDAAARLPSAPREPSRGALELQTGSGAGAGARTAAAAAGRRLARSDTSTASAFSWLAHRRLLSGCPEPRLASANPPAGSHQC